MPPSQILFCQKKNEKKTKILKIKQNQFHIYLEQGDQDDHCDHSFNDDGIFLAPSSALLLTICLSLDDGNTLRQ